MPRLRITTSMVFCVAMGLSLASAHAQCGELKQFIRDETAGPDKFVDTFSFRRNHRADSVLMLVKDSVQKGRLPKALAVSPSNRKGHGLLRRVAERNSGSMTTLERTPSPRN